MATGDDHGRLPRRPGRSRNPPGAAPHVALTNAFLGGREQQRRARSACGDRPIEDDWARPRSTSAVASNSAGQPPAAHFNATCFNASSAQPTRSATGVDTTRPAFTDRPSQRPPTRRAPDAGTSTGSSHLLPAVLQPQQMPRRDQLPHEAARTATQGAPRRGPLPLSLTAGPDTPITQPAVVSPPLRFRWADRDQRPRKIDSAWGSRFSGFSRAGL